MSDVRRCLGCGNTYPLPEHECPKCGSHAADVEQEKTAAKPKPTRRRKT
jgi:rRNA maturation endonuclease Nob1